MQALAQEKEIARTVTVLNWHSIFDPTSVPVTKYVHAKLPAVSSGSSSCSPSSLVVGRKEDHIALDMTEPRLELELSEVDNAMVVEPSAAGVAVKARKAAPVVTATPAVTSHNFCGDIEDTRELQGILASKAAEADREMIDLRTPPRHTPSGLGREDICCSPTDFEETRKAFAWKAQSLDGLSFDLVASTSKGCQDVCNSKAFKF